MTLAFPRFRALFPPVRGHRTLMATEQTSHEERRDYPRVPPNSARPIRVEIPIDGYLVPSTVTPHDLSLSGIRGRWENALPEGEDFPMYLDLGKPIKLIARVAWQRKLPHDSAVSGLHFVKVSKRAAQAIRGYIKGLQQVTRRTAPRVDDIIPVEILTSSGAESFTTIASDLSRDGIQLSNDFALPDEHPIKVLLPLSWDAPIEVDAQVRWQKKTSFGGYSVGLQFINTSEDIATLIDTYILALTEIRHTMSEEDPG